MAENKTQIYAARITKVNYRLQPAPDGVLNLNCLNFFTNNVTQTIKIENAICFDWQLRIKIENIW